MIVLFDTSTPTARMTLVIDGKQHEIEWEAGRELAKGIFGWLDESLSIHNATVHDITGIGVFSGPGSFTGLRIGITVANTFADSLSIPVVACSGDGWKDECIKRLNAGENDEIILPQYDRDANITKPRK